MPIISNKPKKRNQKKENLYNKKIKVVDTIQNEWYIKNAKWLQTLSYAHKV